MVDTVQVLAELFEWKVSLRLEQSRPSKPEGNLIKIILALHVEKTKLVLNTLMLCYFNLDSTTVLLQSKLR